MKESNDAHQMRMLHDREVDVLFHEAVQTNPDYVEVDLARVAADLAYFSELHADAVLENGSAEIELKQIEAKLNIAHRERLIALTEPDAKGHKKAPTVDAVKSAVECDDQYIAARRQCLTAEVAMVRARGRMDAVRTKKDAIIQIALTRRAEMMVDPAVAADHREKKFAQRIHEGRQAG